jgi:MYXO-CTERM domain-containing protein
MNRALGLCALLCAFSGDALAAPRPRTMAVMVPPRAKRSDAVASNIIYLNQCTGNCIVTEGNSNSTTDTSDLGQGTLSAFSYGTTTWNSVVSCLADVFSPFNVQLVTTRPSSSSYLEIMIAGSPQEIGLPTDVGGVATYICGEAYQENALVFDFANVWNGSVEDICATAAQEIAHTWTLDHSTDAADPMTYFSYATRKYFQNSAQQCGSDCVNGVSPFNLTCSGTNNQSHNCTCTGQATENTYQTILDLFGAGTPTPPTVAITTPANNASVAPGFPVDATVTSPYGVTSAELEVDGMMIATLTSMPFAFNAPSMLSTGAHTVTVVGTDVHGVMTNTMINVTVGQLASLGTTCKTDSQCASNQCASDGTNSYCTEPCPASGGCPDGLQCLTQGSGSGGVCWPSGGGGGCSVDGDRAPLGPIAIGLATLAFVISRRRRRV